jgi:hypothetical protein
MAKLSLVLLLATALIARGEEPAKSVRISFVPPPLDGTFSLGIYDGSGKLVRVLQREAELDDFEIGQDALSTTWDGKNDAGAALPAGKYHARGYAVASGDVEGIGFFFNDWVKDDHSLRIRKMSELTAENGLPVLRVLIGDQTLTAMCDAAGNIAATGERSLPTTRCSAQAAPPQLIEPISCDTGKDGTRWIIDRVSPSQAEVKQLSRGNELLRHLSIAPEDPQPREIAASKESDTIFLLEETGPVQRLRSLTLVAKSGGSSDWKVDFEKKIVAHSGFTIENGKPVVSGGKAPNDRISIKLQPNPLKNDARETLELFPEHDENGSYLRTADGLPLQSISETPHLTRVVLSPRGENAVDVFQDDEAVVEQFRIGDLDEIMSFDCGEIELK